MIPNRIIMISTHALGSLASPRQTRRTRQTGRSYALQRAHWIPQSSGDYHTTRRHPRGIQVMAIQSRSHNCASPSSPSYPQICNFDEVLCDQIRQQPGKSKSKDSLMQTGDQTSYSANQRDMSSSTADLNHGPPKSKPRSPSPQWKLNIWRYLMQHAN